MVAYGIGLGGSDTSPYATVFVEGGRSLRADDELCQLGGDQRWLRVELASG